MMVVMPMVLMMFMVFVMFVTHNSILLVGMYPAQKQVDAKIGEKHT